MKSSRVTYSAEELAMYGISNARYRKRRRFRINKTLPITAGCVVMGFGIGVTGSIYVKSEFDLIKPEVRVETGSFVSKDVFFTGELVTTGDVLVLDNIRIGSNSAFDGIRNIDTNSEKSGNIYSINGQVLHKGAHSIKGMKGIYVVDGKKVATH